MAINSFTGDIVNPIVDARVDKSFSANALAKKLGLSRQYISRAEAGTYSSLNPALLKWTSNALDVTPQTVELLYKKFQRATRRATVEKTGPAKLERHSDAPGNKLFEHWRAGYWTSPMQFATAFCVHPDSVQKYEEGIQTQMPKPIKEVLIEAGLLDGNWTDRVEATGSPLTA